MKQRRRGIIRAANSEDFPGYQQYPAQDDIMNRAQRVEGNLTGESLQDMRHPPKGEVGGDLRTTQDSTEEATSNVESVASDESKVTAEDLEALGPKDLSLDMGDDEQQLKHRITPVDFSGKDLDIPGAELDDDREAIGAEDEENNGYSLGGENHEALEEDQS